MAFTDILHRLTRHEAFGAVLLMVAAALAMVIANSPLLPAYDAFLEAKLAITINGTGLAKPLFLWINDGLMAVFFFLVGLELKREIREGKLSNLSDVVLPGMAALGGMAAPALIFVALNQASAATLGGWAIPTATDIAFALGVLALAGPRVPPSLKIFLLTLAILDDLGAIIIIALFYGHGLNLPYLFSALVPLAGLIVLNLRGTSRLAPALVLGAIMWVLVLKSGIHATLAGVVTAFCIPLTDRTGASPLHRLEEALTPWVNFAIIPLFAFANAGVVLTGLSLSDLSAPLPLGVGLGLLIGKMTGVFGVTWAMVRLGLAGMPAGASWGQVFGVACLAGIGFTMSLFIGGLSFDDQAMMNQVRLGVLAGSGIAGLLGWTVLRFGKGQPHGG